MMLVRYKSIWRALRAFPQSGYSSSPVAGVNPVSTAVAATAESSSETSIPKATEISKKRSSGESHNKPGPRLINAAFSNLKEINFAPEISDEITELDSEITAAETVENLLKLSQKKELQRNQALKIVSKLADWTSNNKIKLNEFEGDPRFVKLCEALGHQVSTKSSTKLKIDRNSVVTFSDLGVVLGVAGDDEAAKLVNTITVPQMIKVLSSLAYKKRRSIPLLRSLAFNIGKSDDQLNIKDCADVLYSCAQLSFQDEVLFEKVCSDLCLSINTNKKPAVVGSIITSLGFLRYKDKELLDLICEWVDTNFSVCRIQDLTSLLLTLATVHHIPVNGDSLFAKLETHLQQSDLSTPLLWLDVVWALVVLEKATPNHLSSVLNPEFIDRLGNSLPDGLGVTAKLKFLNVNGAAKLYGNNYSGPILESDSEITKVEVPRGKDKQAFAQTVIETLSNLLPSTVYMNTNINTGMGFIIDGECILDSNLTPVRLNDKTTGKPLEISDSDLKKGTKIAVIVLDYHDITRGASEPTGIASLAIRLTEKSGYNVLTIPYNEFNPKDKIVTRVQYIEQQLKNIVKSTPSS